MNFYESILLGLVQGATEFLPVSSSGHLILLRKIFNINEMSLLLEVALHIGTLISILCFWFKDYLIEIKLILKGNLETLLKIIIGCIPAAIIGFFFKEDIRMYFYSINSISYLTVSYFMMSLLLLSTKFFKKNNVDSISYINALLIGCVQAIAIIPGISRSGITIAIALLLGISFRASIKFSFILVIPILIFAGLDSMVTDYSLITQDINTILFLLTGVLFSSLSGYIFLFLLNKILINNKFWLFSFYCLFISILLLIFNYE
tara:strand:+ start:347 stop:1132 length:786 start_codon:yes stop_codon:yes gene_type:complete